MRELFLNIFGPLIKFLKTVDKDNNLLKNFLISSLIIVFFETLIVPLMGIGFDYILNSNSNLNFLGYNIRLDIYIISISLYLFIRLYSFKRLYSEKYKFSIRLPYEYTIFSSTTLVKLKNKFRNKLKKNDLSRVITTETENVVWRYMVQVADTFTETIVFIILILLITKVDFLAGIGILLFSFIYLIFRLKGVVHDTENINESKLRESISRDSEILQNGLISLLPMVNNKWLHKNLTIKFRNLEKDQIKLILIPIFQKVKIELIILFILGLLTLLVSNELITFSSNIGILIFSIYRVIISLSRITSLLLSIEGSKNSVNYYISFLSYPFTVIQKNIENITFNKNNSERKIFWDKFSFKISKNRYTEVPKLHLKQGEICLITGASGIGKTTLLRNIFKWDDKLEKFIQNEFDEINIIYIPQESYIFRSSLIDNILLSEIDDYEFTKKRISENLISMGFSRKRLKELFLLDDISNYLSGGEAHRVCLCRTIFSSKYSNNPLILFDEPTSSLDEESSLKTIDWIMSLSGVKLIVTHNSFYYKRFPNIKILNLKAVSN
tara:strand:+ start:14711 stop:16372 length:1662 start_codon:yes stop_codon:yes gene_type:complete